MFMNIDRGRRVAHTLVLTCVLGAVAPIALAGPEHQHGASRPDDHAPIGVMGDHAHKKGEFMISARVMHMEMSGNQIGTDDVSPDTIVTTVPNRFAGMPGQPPASTSRSSAFPSGATKRTGVALQAVLGSW